MRDTMVAEVSLRTRRGLWVLPLVAALAGVFGWSCAVAAGLNDTGFTTCADASGATVSCTAATAVQGQDARYGRDAAAGTGALTKVGGGANGFDFTKISNAGAVLPSTAPLGTAAGDWGCTYDNTTGLMWEVKTTSGLRNVASGYSWYSSNAATNGGAVGYANGGICVSPGRCNTENFFQDVNSVGMCGHSDWRMPTLRELHGIRLFAANQRIDAAYFPDYPDSGNYTWTGAPMSGNPGSAWVIDFGNGSVYPSGKGSLAAKVRLVRVGQ